jgi:hypothetical protein
LVGGSIMLFTSPVGRQEFENIDFLERNDLLPNSLRIAAPRAIKLSKNPEVAAEFILWALDSGLFAKMSSENFRFSKHAVSSGEIGPDGTRLFWRFVEEYFN